MIVGLRDLKRLTDLARDPPTLMRIGPTTRRVEKIGQTARTFPKT